MGLKKYQDGLYVGQMQGTTPSGFGVMIVLNGTIYLPNGKQFRLINGVPQE